MSTSLLDSHHHLGINEPPPNRVGYRRETVCSPLITAPNYVEITEGDAGGTDNVTIKYLYGPQGALHDYTHVYNTNNFYGETGYSVRPLRHFPGRGGGTWVPIDALKTDRSDITLLLIVHNSIMHLERNDDPVFSANFEYLVRGAMRYLPDRPISPIACIDRYQICNPTNDECTPLQASNTLGDSLDLQRLDLNAAQRATAMRLAYLSRTKSFDDLIFTRTHGFLRAQDRVTHLIQHRLPSDQWCTEMGALFSDALSLLQHQVMRYPTGPARPGNISVEKPWVVEGSASRDSGLDVNSAWEAMCHKQRVKVTDGTLNFSVLGLGILLGIGSFLIALSFILEPAVAFVQKKAGIGAQKARQWERDDSLQVMRMLFEANGAGDWEGTPPTFPRTKTAQKFEYGTPPGSEQHSFRPQYLEGDHGRTVYTETKIRRKPVASASPTQG